MSYGTGREKRKKLRKLKAITNDSLADFMRLAADQFIGDYAKMVNDRASERETQVDKDFLSSIARKDFMGAYEAFQRDVNNMNMEEILMDIVKDRTSIDYDNLADNIKQLFSSSAVRSQFFDSSRAGIRRILQAPLQMGLSRTVLQKYLQA